MGVMSCHRKSCPNIMCDTYIDEIGYVCTDCQIEFKEQMDKEQNVLTNEGEIRQQLKRFMEKPKINLTYKPGEEMSIDEFFRRKTRE